MSVYTYCGSYCESIWEVHIKCTCFVCYSKGIETGRHLEDQQWKRVTREVRVTEETLGSTTKATQRR